MAMVLLQIVDSLKEEFVVKDPLQSGLIITPLASKLTKLFMWDFYMEKDPMPREVGSQLLLLSPLLEDGTVCTKPRS